MNKARLFPWPVQSNSIINQITSFPQEIVNYVNQRFTALRQFNFPIHGNSIDGEKNYHKTQSPTAHKFHFKAPWEKTNKQTNKQGGKNKAVSNDNSTLF